MCFTLLAVYFFPPIKLYKLYKGEMQEQVSRKIAIILLELVY